MKDRRDRTLLFYSLLTNLDRARDSSAECTHHMLEHRMRSNWKAVEHILGRAIAEGWVELDPGGRTYRITDRGREFRALLGRAISPIYVDYLERKR